jgi:hypothetical protein
LHRLDATKDQVALSLPDAALMVHGLDRGPEPVKLHLTMLNNATFKRGLHRAGNLIAGN